MTTPPTANGDQRVPRGATGPAGPAGPSEPVADPELCAAAQAARRAAAQGTSLLAVLTWYVKEGRSLRGAPLIRDCAREFLWSKANANRRPDTMNGYKTALTRLACRFGDRQPSAVTPRDIFDFLRPWRQPNTRSGWYHRLSTFFEWLVMKKYACTNPVAAGTKPRGTGGNGSIYTPEEARELLRRARNTDQLGFWVLSLFAGMRTSEIERLQALASPWSLVRLGDAVIEIPAGHSKSRRRTIRMTPVLREWLRVLRRQGRPFHPSNDGARKIRRLRYAVLREFRGSRRLTGAFNMGRRSFISYRLALARASYAEVAATAGNSERVIRKYYRRPVTRESARAYFRLTPARVESTSPLP